MFSFTDFKNFVKRDGLARQNRFYVNMSPPGLNADPNEASFFNNYSNYETIHLLCKSVSVPGVSVSSADIRLTGEILQAPYDRNFSPATFSFYVDRNFIVRQFFESWVNTIQDPVTRVMSYYKEFVSDQIDIFVVSKSETPIVYKISLFDCFPKALSPITLDTSSNEFMTIDVEMDYHYYKTEMITTTEIETPNGSADTFEYIPEKKNAGTLSGTPVTGVGALNSISSNTANSLYNDFNGALNTFNSSFTGFQNAIQTGRNVFNGVTSSIGSISNLSNFKNRAITSVKNEVSKQISGRIGDIIKVNF
jgi:hypothetical protein